MFGIRFFPLVRRQITFSFSEIEISLDWQRKFEKYKCRNETIICFTQKVSWHVVNVKNKSEEHAENMEMQRNMTGQKAK